MPSNSSSLALLAARKTRSSGLPGRLRCLRVQVRACYDMDRCPKRSAEQQHLVDFLLFLCKLFSRLRSPLGPRGDLLRGYHCHLLPRFSNAKRKNNFTRSAPAKAKVVKKSTHTAVVRKRVGAAAWFSQPAQPVCPRARASPPPLCPPLLPLSGSFRALR